MDDIKVLTISDLIQRGLPLTGTYVLHQSSSCNSIPVDLFQSNVRHVPSTTSSPAESNPSPKVLTSLKRPAIIIGTLNLPTGAPGPSNLHSSCRCPSNNCFQFTDGSATICCDILDIDIGMMGKEIRVLSWNFIPLRTAGGFLEIIKWDFLYPSGVLPRCSNVDPVLLDAGVTSFHSQGVCWGSLWTPYLFRQDYGYCFLFRLSGKCLPVFYLKKRSWDQKMCYQKEGLVQMYAKSHLPLSIYRYQHGAMMKLYEHDSCGCGSEPHSISLVTVVPISVLIFHCKFTWMRTTRLKNERVIMCEYDQFNQFRLLSCGGRSFHQTTRKVYRSEDIGFVLVGSLKISTYSGRLQLVDVTGGVDVIVPDLPSTWNAKGIYEVTKYILVMEGIPQMEKYLPNESFSCRSFFQSISLERDLRIAIFVYFHYRNATCKNLPLYSRVDSGYDIEIFESGTYHLLQVTHKFPMLQKFQGKHLAPNTSSMFVEAVVYSWNLFLTERDKRYSTKASMKQLTEDSGSANYQRHVDKRLKIDHQSGRVEGSDIVCNFGDSSCGFNGCCDCYEGSNEEHECCNLNHHRISCVATISSKHGSQDMSGFLFNTRCRSSSGCSYRLNAQRILLEIEPESTLKYQFLQIGNYYITKHYKDHSLFNIEESNCVNGQKFLLTSSTRLWSISFNFNDDILHSIESNNTRFNDFPFCDGGVISRDQIDLHYGTFSDIYLHLPSNAKDILVFELDKQEEDLIKPVLRPEEIGKNSPCYRDVTTSYMKTSVSRGSDCLFPEGNLLSLQGHVVAVHDLRQSCIDSDLKCQSNRDGSQCRFFMGATSTCIHLLVEDQIVKIFGCSKNYNLPVGFGPGVNATFHRVLELGDQRRLMLTPLSFIDISSFRVLDYSSTEKYFDSISYSDNISLQLFSELIHSAHCKLTKFRCRVVAVNILVLEKNIDHVNFQFEIPRRPPLVKIPLAGFMLDDGSSRCNCWTSGEKAAALLRLNDPLPQFADWTLNWTGMACNSGATASYHLGRVVKNHGRIIVRSCGSILNSYQDLDISLGSDDALSSADESFLKFILVNSCLGAIWTVIGSQLDSDAVRSLLKGHIMEPGLMQSHNIWATEVCRTNALNEARNAILELVNN
ncbi:CST complex subunit CTC1 isoform X2 [Momordica charantia]|uniref:CST complex subunit CTC1 n=1 Tax=Momordica charantia TaxID=3673 RepID=A0A6J1CE41_MOMCH|nr:CST complex subunit CTC1 isoform X2 [Momordica charantia]